MGSRPVRCTVQVRAEWKESSLRKSYDGRRLVQMPIAESETKHMPLVLDPQWRGASFLPWHLFAMCGRACNILLWYVLENSAEVDCKSTCLYHNTKLTQFPAQFTTCIFCTTTQQPMKRLNGNGLGRSFWQKQKSVLLRRTELQMAWNVDHLGIGLRMLAEWGSPHLILILTWSRLEHAAPFFCNSNGTNWRRCGVWTIFLWKKRITSTTEDCGTT